MKNKVVVLGSYNVDMTIKTKKIPSPGETVIGGPFSTGGGGKGANQAIAAARLGADVSFIARVGNDLFGQEAIKKLNDEHIDTRFIFRDSQLATGVAFIVVDDSAENSIVVASGANAALSVEDIEKVKAELLSADILLVQLESPVETVKAAINIAKQNGATVILNPAPAQKLDTDLLTNIDIITPNIVEAEMLTGIKATDTECLTKIVNKFFEYGIKNVFITMGSKGYFAGSINQSVLVPAYKVTSVDTTGAGDVFSGSLAAFLAEGIPIDMAARMANGAASISVTRVGAQNSAPKKVEVEEFMMSHNIIESEISS
ncbi:MAG TPA: ribokinase [Ignavibacteriaceae bacterium]|nr:ribokinase [Ignavibacterium sp.]HMN17300.1 ribokinase [Ignavibacteriaceae bacterium]